MKSVSHISIQNSQHLKARLDIFQLQQSWWEYSQPVPSALYFQISRTLQSFRGSILYHTLFVSLPSPRQDNCLDFAFSLIFPHILSFFSLFFAHRHQLANVYILEGNILFPPFLPCMYSGTVLHDAEVLKSLQTSATRNPTLLKFNFFWESCQIKLN